MSEELFTEGVDYPAQSFDTDEELEEGPIILAARKAFGVRYLFPWQQLVISNILDSAKATREDNGQQNELNDDVCRGRQVVLLPTGAGKSLCFLTPAILLPGATLVIYPLLALMADQERRMHGSGLDCVVLKGGLEESDKQKIFSKIRSGVKVIIANPEVLQAKQIIRVLKEIKISHIAIDEAHCVSEWGDTFRPSYLTLGKIIKELGVNVVTAFTATASPVVLGRIQEVLFEEKAHLLQSPADRANIHYEVRYAYAKKKAALKAVIESKKPLIVFCSTRDRTEDMARLIDSYYNCGNVRFYHAGLSKEEKNKIEKWFFDSSDGILTATCAYGMGMDKGNIFTVIHLDAPEHLENFIQEAGRAGRKGDNVNSILIWSHQDTARCRHMSKNSRERVMLDFAYNKTCRRNFMLNYLSGEHTECAGCDVCDARAAGKELSFRAKDAQATVRFIRKYSRMFTKDECTHELTEIFNKEDLPLLKKNIWESSDIREILNQLMGGRRIKKTGGPWKDRLQIVKRKTGLLNYISPRQRHRLHHLRRRLLHLKAVLDAELQKLS